MTESLTQGGLNNLIQKVHLKKNLLKNSQSAKKKENFTKREKHFKL